MRLVWKYGRLSSIPFLKSSIPFQYGIFHTPYRNFHSILSSILFNTKPACLERFALAKRSLYVLVGFFQFLSFEFSKCSKPPTGPDSQCTELLALLEFSLHFSANTKDQKKGLRQKFAVCIFQPKNVKTKKKDLTTHVRNAVFLALCHMANPAWSPRKDNHR